IMREADPEVVEEWKWVMFYRGASLDDPKGLFNSSLDGKVRRAIDMYLAEDENASPRRLRRGPKA
ncbi:MAG TPA: hypothetical protein VEH29_18120, partial [Acidimicrobiales bacterium]|nr:hypothetical protein [Acidimicrobiales bacterium]